MTHKMTHKEENIVNIAMMAAELLKDGKIERSDITGHAGFTEDIIDLAYEFEMQYKNIDFDSGDHDYWIEIDAFAERNLLEMFGRVQPPVAKTPMTIYLCPKNEHTYSAAAVSGTPPFDGAIKLAEERDYPAEVIYTRTDLNGSTCLESERCASMSELLSALDWCGKCGYTVHELWDFDLGKTQDKGIVDLFDDVYQHRMKRIGKEAERIDPETPQPLSEQIQGAHQRMGQTPQSGGLSRSEPSIN